MVDDGHSVCIVRDLLEDERMLVHSVYFWLKPDLTDVQRAAFLHALSALKDVPGVTAFYLGTPASVPARPVVELSFDHSITCVFENLAAHDAYQAHALHLAFLEVGRPLWSRVQIYDAD